MEIIYESFQVRGASGGGRMRDGGLKGGHNSVMVVVGR